MNKKEQLAMEVANDTLERVREERDKLQALVKSMQESGQAWAKNLGNARRRAEAAEAEASKHQKGHAAIARGVKDALGIKNWPKFDGTFRDGVAGLVSELQAEVARLEEEVRFLAGEGPTDDPELLAWRRLAAIPREQRTPEQASELRKVARLLQTDWKAEAADLRAEVGRLKDIEKKLGGAAEAIGQEWKKASAEAADLRAKLKAEQHTVKALGESYDDLRAKLDLKEHECCESCAALGTKLERVTRAIEHEGCLNVDNPGMDCDVISCAVCYIGAALGVKS